MSNGRLQIKTTLDDVLKKQNISGSAFAKKFLKKHPNYMTNMRKRKNYDPKLSTVIGWATLLGKDIHEFFQCPEYEQATKSRGALPVTKKRKKKSA